MRPYRQENEELTQLCRQARQMTEDGELDACETLLGEAMRNHPHAPEPHNLLGMLLERRGDHLTAMKHFRAAQALDPAYEPSAHNLEVYGGFFTNRRQGAWSWQDCGREETARCALVYDSCGVGRIAWGHV